MKINFKAVLAIAGDITAMYAALILALLMRYPDIFRAALGSNITPFSVIFAVWIIIFYAAGLYDLSRLKNNIDFFKILSVAFAISLLVTIAFFYIFPLGIAPRRNLFLFIIIFGIIEGVWRRYFNMYAGFKNNSIRVLLLGEGERFEELGKELKSNPQLGYSIREWIKKSASPDEAKNIHEIVRRHEVEMVVVPHTATRDLKLAQMFYDFLTSGIIVSDFPGFYETVFRKIPLSDLEATWFLEHVSIRQPFYDNLKRAIEFAAALAMLLIVFPLFLIIAILIKLTSRGPVIYSQARVGYKNRHFILYKFRTMYSDAEKDGAKWSDKNDVRITPVGRFLRYTHLDELPQLWNILKGELSFVGPRPERPEFVSLLRDKIKYYDIRHLVKPGITGWAQISYRYGSSVEDAYEKLQYDIYYLKNRSPILDVAIIFKTLRSFFVNNN